MQTAEMPSAIREARSVHLDARWEAVLARDTASDGTFVFAVRTTGVYCRPSCPSKRARPENVTFYPDPPAAAAAGFRPCRRCSPETLTAVAPHAAVIAEACRRIEGDEQAPTLAMLARAARMSPSHFHRQFKLVTGLTPKAYAIAGRAARMRTELTGAATVTNAIYAAGYGSSSRFYEQAEQAIGMKAKSFRDGGASAEIRFAVGQCRLGAILVAQSRGGICAILLDDDPERLVHDLQDRFPNAALVGCDRSFETSVAAVIAFVEAPQVGFDLPLDLQGTAFQQRVWNTLRLIPPGQTVSYAELARRIGQPRSARAVAQACAANPVAVAVPCHRVVRNDGAISGYRWGVERKRALLTAESGGSAAQHPIKGQDARPRSPDNGP